METKKISKIKAALGLDIGNGTIKFALITKEGKLIDWVYIKNLGVIETIKKGLKKLRKDVEITAVGTTGAGRKLGGAFIGADITKTEILAHAVGALHFIPNVQTIFDLGQEDSKILILRNEVLVDFGMNQICLPGDTKITAESYIPKPIKDVKPNEKVLTHRGQFKKAKNKFIRNYSGKILKIKVGKKELKITPEHPVLALKRDTIKCYRDFREGKIEKIRVCKPLGERNVDWCKRHRCKRGSKMFYEPEFIQAKELKTGDFIVTPLPQEINNKEYLDWKGKTIYLKHHKLREVNTFPFTPKTLRILGYYLAEGSINRNRKRTNKKIKHLSGICFVFNIKEKKYVDEIIQTIKKNFDVSTKVSFLPRHKTLKLEVHNKSLAAAIQHLCGEYSNRKEISAELMALDPKLQLEMAKGYFIGDAHLKVKKGNKSSYSYTATTVSEKLAHQIYWILLRNQIKCKLYSSNKKTKGGKVAYHIAIYGNDINKLINKKILSNAKRSPFKSFIYSSWLFEPIEKIKEERFRGKVYNLKVEDDDSYVANLLTVHNCSGGCGAYLENVAFRLGIPIEKFGGLALKAKSTATISGKCLTEDNLLLTDKSLKSIKDVKISDMVLSNGRYNKVFKKYERPYTGNIYKIFRRYANKFPLILTEEHPVLAIKTKLCPYEHSYDYVCNSKCKFHKRRRHLNCPHFHEKYSQEWIKVEELRPKDWVVTPRYDIEKKPDHDKELMRLAGYYLAEGSITDNMIEFAFGKNETDYHKDVKKLMTKIFSAEIKKDKRAYGGLVLRFKSSKAIKFFKQFRERAYTKELPLWCIDLPKGHLMELIKGVWRGDGNYERYRLEIRTTSPCLFEQLSLILEKCGFIPSKEKDEGGINEIHNWNRVTKRNVIKRHVLYTIGLGGTQINKLVKKIECKKPKNLDSRTRTYQLAKINKNYIAYPITKIKKVFKSNIKVYNLEVNGNPSYMTNSFLCHNCAVFGTTSCVHKLNAGVAKENILSGVAKSLVRNYLALVAKGKDIKPPYIFQGGVALNKAVVKALEEELSHKVIVPKHAPIIGAIGAAILAQEQKPTKSLFKGFNLANFQYTTASFTCHKCSNRCEVINIIRDGKKIASLGSRCGRYNIDFSKPR